MRNTTTRNLSTRISILASTLLFAFAVAGCAGTTGSSDSNGGDGEESTESQSTSPSTCPGGCPDGQFCFNGLCALGCNSNQDCAEDQYCATDEDRLCHNKQVPECSSDDECGGNQVCTKGYCSAQPETADECEPSPDGNDGCGEYAVCVEEESGNTCYTLPKCSAEGTCPTGQAGAVCNDGHIPNKAEICLLGLCEDTSNCPDGWSCQKASDSQVLGYCWSGGGGGTGSQCETDSDCDSGNCQGSDSPGPGICE